MLFPGGFTVSVSCVVLLIVQSGHGSEIIGGKEVDPHSLPFMALLMERHVCGGTLINPKWVLTAAHCAKDKTIFKEVLLGVHAINKEETDSRQVIKVERQIPHPCYDPELKINDLMLLKLKKPAKQTTTVRCLPLGNTIKDPAVGATCLVAGWGKTNNRVNQMSSVLRSVNVTVIDRKKCNSPDYYGSEPVVITSNMICAGSDGKNTADTCKGDSGGPLLCNGLLVGVTSFGGSKCGQMKKPGVYTFLSEKQLNWIKKTMKKPEI